MSEHSLQGGFFVKTSFGFSLLVSASPPLEGDLGGVSTAIQYLKAKKQT